MTTVHLGTASRDILQALSLSAPGRLTFDFGLLCYAFMAAPTFFIGLTIFGSMDLEEGNNVGVTVLFAWCLYFIPIGLLSVRHSRSARPALVLIL